MVSFVIWTFSVNFVKNTALDVITLSETKLSTDISNSEIVIPNFKVVSRKDRNQNGGGVLIMVKDHLQALPRHDLSSDNTETVWSEVKIPGTKSVLVASCYRPPNQSINTFLDSFESQLDSITGRNPTYIFGDFNIDMQQPSGTYQKKLLDLTSDFQLKQLINNPTRTTASTATIIDLVFSSEHTSHNGVIPLGISDHDLIFCVHKSKLPRPQPKFVKTRNWKTLTKMYFFKNWVVSHGPLLRSLTM